MNAFPRWFLAALLCVLPWPLRASPGASPPAFPARLTRTVSGIRFEYSPGQDAIVDAFAARAAVWNRETRERETEWRKQRGDDPLPLSAADLRANRDLLLRQIASELGLDAPSALQTMVFNRMFKPLEELEAASDELTEAAWRFSQIRQVTVWEKPELAARLQAGEKIPSFSWDAKDQTVNFQLNAELSGSDAQKKAEASVAREKQKLETTFLYNVDHGVAQIDASFTVNPKGTGQIVAEPLPPRPKYQSVDFGPSIVFPVVRKESELQLPLDQFVENALKNVRDIQNWAGRPEGNRNLALAHTLLHEVVEAGLVERYIGSSDRRWFCDGVANYLAWKIIRDRAGLPAAQAAYNLDAQLKTYAALQPQVHLRRWQAAGRKSKTDANEPLKKAHYAFATRAIFLMSQLYGEDTLRKLLRELGRTPRANVTMKTVARSFQRTTGQPLNELLHAAETRPVVLPSPGAKPEGTPPS